MYWPRGKKVAVAKVARARRFVSMLAKDGCALLIVKLSRYATVKGDGMSF